jgi:hypothetical protein
MDIRAQLSPAKLYGPGSDLWIQIDPESVVLLPRLAEKVATPELATA